MVELGEEVELSCGLQGPEDDVYCKLADIPHTDTGHHKAGSFQSTQLSRALSSEASCGHLEVEVGSKLKLN